MNSKVRMQLNSLVTDKIVVAKLLPRDALVKAIGLSSLGIIASDILAEDIDYLISRNMLVPIVLVQPDQLLQITKQQSKRVFLDGSSKTILMLE